MARPLRIEYEGAVHHVTARGNERGHLFRDERDHEAFIERIATQVDRHAVRLHLYCLMPNHFHLVVETPRANLGQFMQGLQTSYAVFFNRRHQRVGHLLQGRYVSRLVEANTYLLRLSQYVHLNPVCIRLVRSLALLERRNLLRAFPWSSYRSYIGLVPRLPFVTYDPVLSHVAAGAGDPGRQYRRFVELGLAETDDQFEQMMRQPSRGLGDDDFLRRVDALHREGVDARRQEDVSFRRAMLVAEPPEVMDAIAAAFNVDPAALTRRSHGSLARPAAAWLLCRCAGLTQRQVATWLHLGTGAAVCIQVRRFGQLLQSDPALRCLVDKLQHKLKQDK